MWFQRTTMEDEKLIENVHAFECLYNNKIKEYKDAAVKLAAWEDISRKLKIPVSVCKTKWNQLRNAFLHAMIRRKSVTGVKHFKKWKYEDELNFLLPYMSLGTRDTVSNVENNEQDHDSTETQDEEDSSRDHTPDSYYSNKRKVDNHDEMLQMMNEKRQCIKVEEDEVNETDEFLTPEGYSKGNVDYHEEVLQIIKEKMQVKKVEKDEIDLLFESLAKAVKQLPKSEQIKLKIDVTKIVYEAQMRCESQF